MPLTVNLPNFTIGENAYDEIATYCAPFGTKVAIIGGKKALEASQERLLNALSKTELEAIDTIWYGKNANLSNIDRLSEIESVKEADMLFAVGGGRAIDAVKSVAHRLDKPVFSFPTIASTCAPTSAVCVLYEDSGEMHGLEMLAQPPVHSFADSTVIAEAPTEYLWAGIGDAITKEIEATFSARDRELSFENDLGVKIVQGCNERLLANGKAAMDAANEHKASPAIDKVLQEIIGTTALTSVLVDNDYNSNLAHALYYGATATKSGETHLHGEWTCYGALVLLTMDKQYETRDKLFEFMKSINLSTNLEQLELTTEEDFNKMLDKCMAMDDIKVSPYEITREMVVSAIQEVEELHKL